MNTGGHERKEEAKVCKGEKGWKGEPNGGNENRWSRTSLETPRKTSLRLHVNAVCAPKNGTGSNEPWTSFGRCDHVRLARGLPPLTAAVTYRREPTWNSIIRQVLANNFGLGHLRSLRAALYPGRGYVRQTPVRRVHGRHSAGSSRALTRRDTLIEMGTDVNAVPHAGLSKTA